MLIHKITIGFVTQVWDTEKKEWLSQNFTAGDECEYEFPDGEPADCLDMNHGGDEPYLPFEMIQPKS